MSELDPNRARHGNPHASPLARSVLDAAPFAVFQMNERGVILDANAEACRSLGYTLEELVGRSVREVDAELEVTAAFEPGRPDGGAEPCTFTTTHRRKDGTTFPVEVFVTHVGVNAHRQTVEFARNITSRVAAQELQRQLETRMLHAQKLESLGVLAGGIAHDFNNLLSVMLGNVTVAQSLLDAGDSATPVLDKVQTAGKQAAELCRLLLVYAGKERGQRQLVDIGQLVTEQEDLIALSGRRSIEIRYALAEPLPKIEADESQLRQVFMNLVINAAEAIGDAEGRITITARQVDYDRRHAPSVHLGGEIRPGRYVLVEVEDTGCGMTQQVQLRLFDPFFTTKTNGRGLGLAAVLGIVRQHGGGVKVRSESGRGTTFQVLLPVPRATASEPSGVAANATVEE